MTVWSALILLREGLDLPEVSLVAILDADKEGFLRSAVSLIQLAGRAARHINGQVVMYADKETQAMHTAITECNRRRSIQMEYNVRNHITVATIKKEIRESLREEEDAKAYMAKLSGQTADEFELDSVVAMLQHDMELAARNLRFEDAAQIRDEIKKIKGDQEDEDGSQRRQGRQRRQR